jgi:alkylation response protein AidB-like acyl-CoA dehydrogenase
VYLALTDEQDFLVDAAADALGRHETLPAARAALDGAPYPSLWDLASETGWSGLLIAEDADGAELSAYEALLVLEACGRRLADARLLGHLPAAALLQDASADGDLRAALARGERRGALLDATNGERSTVLQAASDGDALVIDGSVRGALDLAGADLLVVVAHDRAGVPVAGVVDAVAPGITITPRAAYDATRNLADVTLAGVRVTALEVAPERVGDGADLQRALLAAESVGAADACLALAREHAIDRHAFGRAIGSYQAIKHKLVEMLRRVEGARSLLVHAGRCWEHDRAAFALAANAARVSAADALDYCAPECIFIHGGVGATWEHDCSLYYRRAELSRRLAGGAEAAAEAVAVQLFAGAPTAAQTRLAEPA